MFFGFFSSKKTKIEEVKDCWEAIKQSVAKANKKEILNRNLKYLHKIIKDLRTTQSTTTTTLISSTTTPNDVQYTSQIYDYFKSNDILCQLIDYCIKHQEQQLILLDDLAAIIYEVKWIPQLIPNDISKLTNKLTELLISQEKKIKAERHKYIFKNSFAFLLNEITRLLLNYPEMILSFKINNDFIIFSNLLSLLQMDEMITSYEIRKYIRRSLIVSLSFDEIASSTYLESCNIPELLVNKLCNYYQMLPISFDIANIDLSIEIGCNIHKSFNILTEFYIEFKDYVAFFNKITNTIRSHKLKTRLKYYLFNKFFIGNVQRRLLSKNQTIFRSNLQYIISMLHDVQNSDIIDVIVNFLFGFNEHKTAINYSFYQATNITERYSHDIVAQSLFNGQTEESNLMIYHHQSDFDISGSYDHSNHLVSTLAYKLLRSLNNKAESINIVSLELFETLIEKRPYLMIHKFIKPYVDFCLKQSENDETVKYHLGKKTYPSIQGLMSMVSLYEKYDTSNMKANIEFNMQRNYSYYMNYDIDFYYYYIDTKQVLDDLEDKSVNENSKEIDDDVNLLEGCLNFDLERNSNATGNQNNKEENQSSQNKRKETEMSNTVVSNEIYSMTANNNNNSKDKEEIQIEIMLFQQVDEIKEEMKNINFLLMRNIHIKFCNYLNNSNYENIFLTNFILTMLSVPCLQFDSDLVECNALLLEDNLQSKFSLLTVTKYISQEIAKKIEQCITFDAFFKRCIHEMNTEKIDKALKLRGTGKEKENEKLMIMRKTSIGASLREGMFTQFEPNLEADYQKNKRDLVNIIIFFEFVKEFITTFSHKYRFENLVEDIYGLYSNLLDDDYYNDINKEMTR